MKCQEWLILTEEWIRMNTAEEWLWNDHQRMTDSKRGTNQNGWQETVKNEWSAKNDWSDWGMNQNHWLKNWPGKNEWLRINHVSKVQIIL